MAQKWLGTLILPGGLLFAVWFVGAVAVTSSPSFNGGSDLPLNALGLRAIAAPIIVAVYLGLHIRPVDPV